MRIVLAQLFTSKALCDIIATNHGKDATVMSATTVSISADYLALVRRYSELAGMSARMAIEYAIDQVLVLELEEYFKSEDDTEVERLTKAANALLPETWLFNVASFGVENVETLVGLNLGLDDILPTYITQSEAQAVRDSLCELPTSGGRFCFGGAHMGNPVLVRRQGQGILFQLLDRTTGKPTGAKTTIASKSALRIAMALDSIISAARRQDEVLA